MARRKNWDLGNVVEIELADGSFSYGVIVPPKTIAFSSKNYTTRQEITPEHFTDIGFTISVMKYAISKKHWPVVGFIELSENLKKEHTYYTFDFIAKKFNHCDASFWFKKEATFEECKGLECAAVWDPEHVESRLLDAKNGVPNVWVDSLKAESHLENSSSQ